MIKKRLLSLFLALTPLLLSAQQEEADLKNKLREPVPKTSGKNAQKIIDNYLKVCGGIDKIKSLKNVFSKGHVIEGKNDYRTEVWESPPNKIRTETIKKLLGTENRVVEGFNGTVAWTYDLRVKHPFPKEKGKVELEALKLKTMFYTPFIHAEEMGLIFTYQGKAYVNGRASYLVKMYYPNGFSEYFYFDAKNFMISKRRWFEIIGKSIVEKDMRFKRYKKVGGIWFPELIEYAIEDQVYGKYTSKGIQINVDIPQEFFDLPDTNERWVRAKETDAP